MARIFISHSSANNAEALALRDWLVACGWDDLFLDIDPQRGLVSGQRWLDRLQKSAQRCKAVLFVFSRAWLASQNCIAELWEARRHERPLFAVVVDDTAVEEVPAEMRGVWQTTFLKRGSHLKQFSVLPPPSYVPTQVEFSLEGLESLRLGLIQAGLTSFDTASFPWSWQAENTARDAEVQRLTRQRTMQRRVGILLTVVAIVTLVGGWLVVTGRRDLALQESRLIAASAAAESNGSRYDSAMRLALMASQRTWLKPSSVIASIQLGRAAHFSRLEAELSVDRNGVSATSFSPDAVHIVVASYDGTVRIWSRGKDGSWRSVLLERRRSPVYKASFSPDGLHIITASDNLAMSGATGGMIAGRAFPLEVIKTGSGWRPSPLTALT